MQKYLELEKRGRVIPITLQVSSYPHGNLAIQLLGWEAGYPEPWSSLTVNLDGRREKNCAFIDTNNNGDNILPWMYRHGLAVPTGVLSRSGYCVYPEFRFRESALREADPEGYENYLDILRSVEARKK